MAKELKRHRKWGLMKDAEMGCLRYILLLFFFQPIILSLGFLAFSDFNLAKLLAVGIIFITVFYFSIRNKVMTTAKKNPYTFSNKTLIFSPFEREILVSLPFLILCFLFLIVSFFNHIYVCLFFILPITSVFIFRFGKLFLTGCRNVINQVNLALKFGTSKLTHKDYVFQKGEVIGLFFLNEKLTAHTQTIEVSLKNIEEKLAPIRDAKDPTKILKEHKFYCHYQQSRKYILETNKIGLVFELPSTDCLATNYAPKNPIYWEVEVKDEACDFHHRFLIDVIN